MANGGVFFYGYLCHMRMHEKPGRTIDAFWRYGPGVTFCAFTSGKVSLKGWQIPYFRTKVQPIGLTGLKVEIERNCYGGILWSLPNPHLPCHKDACAEVGGHAIPFCAFTCEGLLERLANTLLSDQGPTNRTNRAKSRN
ncbi:hypothetical protein H0E87_008166 [Populus deltoides]|uniref:Uncharacterized protein n=1 Tax=Populus deltoides TaxID=3696 RepID=A0A8T2YZF4_POPDE|nr:hypothetical protein H0E87_008166 [Populus deltoides]